MSVIETTSDSGAAARKAGGVFIFLPLLIALLGAAAIVLSQMPASDAAGFTGYGIDERITGAVAPADVALPGL
jgi:hypothetical protein